MFESQFDRENESEIKEHVERVKGVKLVKAKQFSKVDFVLLGKAGNAIALCECKARNVPYSQYPSFFISFAKFEDIVLLCKHFADAKTKKNLDFIIFIKYTDGIYSYKHSPKNNLEIKEGGRKDRGAKNDTELMVHIPTNLLKKI